MAAPTLSPDLAGEIREAPSRWQEASAAQSKELTYNYGRRHLPTAARRRHRRRERRRFGPAHSFTSCVAGGEGGGGKVKDFLVCTTLHYNRYLGRYLHVSIDIFYATSKINNSQ
jgi:hypothetical protein